MLIQNRGIFTCTGLKDMIDMLSQKFFIPEIKRECNEMIDVFTAE